MAIPTRFIMIACFGGANHLTNLYESWGSPCNYSPMLVAAAIVIKVARGDSICNKLEMKGYKVVFTCLQISRTCTMKQLPRLTYSKICFSTS